MNDTTELRATFIPKPSANIPSILMTRHLILDDSRKLLRSASSHKLVMFGAQEWKQSAIVSSASLHLESVAGLKKN